MLRGIDALGVALWVLRAYRARRAEQFDPADAAGAAHLEAIDTAINALYVEQQMAEVVPAQAARYNAPGLIDLTPSQS